MEDRLLFVPTDYFGSLVKLQSIQRLQKNMKVKKKKPYSKIAKVKSTFSTILPGTYNSLSKIYSFYRKSVKSETDLPQSVKSKTDLPPYEDELRKGCCHTVSRFN